MSDRWASKISNLAIVACIGTLGLTLALLVSPGLRGLVGAERSASPAYSLGDVVDLPREMFESRAFTVVYFATTTCGACLRGKDALLELSRTIEGRPEDIAVVFVAPTSDRDAGRGFGAAVGVDPTRHFFLDLAKLRLKKVPTILLLNQSGHVVFAQEHAPDSSTQAAVVARVSSGASN
jgi:hypothetical protein